MEQRCLAIRQRRTSRPLHGNTREVRAAVRGVLRLGGRPWIHRRWRSRSLEDGRRQTLPELLQARAEEVGRGHSGLHRQRPGELAERVEQVKRFVAPLRLRSVGADAGRKATWLELFFDLIFVAAVSQVAAPLREQYTIVGLVRFAPLFVLIWSAWTGRT